LGLISSFVLVVIISTAAFLSCQIVAWHPSDGRLQSTAATFSNSLFYVC
jgi:hypothetical protein